ncbi:MAG TPA: hypothetical protein VF715_01400 [Thermoleophilaceae bacterium]
MGSQIAAEQRAWLRADVAVACMACALVGFSLTLPWLRTGLAGDVRVYGGSSLGAFPAFVIVGSAAAAAMAIWEGCVRGSRRLSLTLAASCAMAAATAMLIVSIETTAAIVPTDMLPKTVRRLGVDVSAAHGLWIAFAGSSVCAVAAMGLPWERLVDGLRRQSAFSRSRSRVVLALVLLVVATGALGWLRYESWLNASAGGHPMDVEGWAMPWIGPASLVALWLLVASIAAAMLARLELAALVAAGAGWLVTFVAALAILINSTLGRLRLDDLELGGVVRADAHFEVAPATWMAFASGVIAACAGGLLIASLGQQGREGSWAPS